jgi:hypothetical protein
MMSAIRDCSISLREFLLRQLRDDPQLSPFFDPTDPNVDAVGTLGVLLDTPQELEDHASEGISLWLYLVQRDEHALNRPPRRVGLERIEAQPLPLRLHYLVTPIVDREARSNASELEQLILGKALQVFHDDTSLHGARLRGSLAGSGLELFVRLEPLSLEEITRVWDALDKPYQLCVSFEVSVLPICSAREQTLARPVLQVLAEAGAASAAQP